MKEAILMSTNPEWVLMTLNGDKIIEIRKTKPKRKLPIDVYIHCTMQDPNSGNALAIMIGNHLGNGKVVAKFTLREVEKITMRKIWGEWEVYGEHTDFIELCRKSCLEQDEIMDYMGGDRHAYAWHISDLVIFDKPKELSEFRYKKVTMKWDENYHHRIVKKEIVPVKRPPQSWQYVEVKDKDEIRRR